MFLVTLYWCVWQENDLDPVPSAASMGGCLTPLTWSREWPEPVSTDPSLIVLWSWQRLQTPGWVREELRVDESTTCIWRRGPWAQIRPDAEVTPGLRLHVAGRLRGLPELPCWCATLSKILQLQKCLQTPSCLSVAAVLISVSPCVCGEWCMVCEGCVCGCVCMCVWVESVLLC